MSRFIIFEGIDGAGTEEQSKRLLDFLRERKIPAERIEYPGYHNPIGKFIHEYLHKKFDLSPEVQSLFYAADMINDKERIKLWLKQGKYVIADRYFTSTLAYQGLIGVPLEKLLKLAELFEVPKPDIVLFLKVSPKTSMQRKLKEKTDLDRNESDKTFLEKLSLFYEQLIKDQVFSQWYALDGEKSKEEVFEQVKKVLRFG
jgi:dTMP kinase